MHTACVRGMVVYVCVNAMLACLVSVCLWVFDFDGEYKSFNICLPFLKLFCEYINVLFPINRNEYVNCKGACV